MQVPDSLRGLKELLQECEARVLAFDIDDTIARSGPGFMRGLLGAFGNPENLTAEAMWAKYGRNPVPYWDMEAVERWCTERLDSPELHEGFSMVEGASEALQKIETHIPIGLFLTIRSESLRTVTRDWLRRYEFPVAPLEMLPIGIVHNDGLAFKAMVLEYLYPEVVGIVDDRKELLSALSPAYEGLVFLYGHSDTADTRAGVICCPAWDDVLFRVREIFTEPSRC